MTKKRKRRKPESAEGGCSCFKKAMLARTPGCQSLVSYRIPFESQFLRLHGKLVIRELISENKTPKTRGVGGV